MTDVEWFLSRPQVRAVLDLFAEKERNRKVIGCCPDCWHEIEEGQVYEHVCPPVPMS